MIQEQLINQILEVEKTSKFSSQASHKREEQLDIVYATVQGNAIDLRGRLIGMMEKTLTIRREKIKQIVDAEREAIIAGKVKDIALAKLETIEAKAEYEKDLAVTKVKRDQEKEIMNIEEKLIKVNRDKEKEIANIEKKNR
ncbi:hypothetical protein MOSE0_F00936 [Monosporozyma servazzii]